MNWKVITLCTLLILSSAIALLFYTTRFETKRLVLHALKWGTTPEYFIDIADNPYRDQIVTHINASVILGREIEIPEHSQLNQWAEGILGDSSREAINVKTGENHYYRVTVQYLYYQHSYTNIIVLISLILTICAWVAYGIFLAKEKIPPKR